MHVQYTCTCMSKTFNTVGNKYFLNGRAGIVLFVLQDHNYYSNSCNGRMTVCVDLHRTWDLCGGSVHTVVSN